MVDVICGVHGLCDIERLEPGRSWRITPEAAEALRSTGLYRGSTGFPFWARHYRRPLPDGSCLHLVILGNVATLHRDQHDPHRGGESLIKHVLLDAPVETGVTVAAVVLIGWLLGGGGA